MNIKIHFLDLEVIREDQRAVVGEEGKVVDNGNIHLIIVSMTHIHSHNHTVVIAAVMVVVMVAVIVAKKNIIIDRNIMINVLVVEKMIDPVHLLRQDFEQI